MKLKKTLAIINQMQATGVIGQYAMPALSAPRFILSLSQQWTSMYLS